MLARQGTYQYRSIGFLTENGVLCTVQFQLSPITASLPLISASKNRQPRRALGLSTEYGVLSLLLCSPKYRGLFGRTRQETRRTGTDANTPGEPQPLASHPGFGQRANAGTVLSRDLGTGWVCAAGPRVPAPDTRGRVVRCLDCLVSAQARRPMTAGPSHTTKTRRPFVPSPDRRRTGLTLV